MADRKAKAELGKHFNGLESWPMSLSYPQSAGEKEFRDLAKEIKDTMESENKKMTLKGSNNKYGSFKERALTLLFGTLEKEIISDEVDGRTEEILTPLVKLYFLKVLLIDIGVI